VTSVDVTVRRPGPTADRRLPGDVNIWVFVLGDLAFFAAYFVIFMVVRAGHPEVFLTSQRHLSLAAGVANTVVLLTSSRFVALAVVAARAGDRAAAIRRTALGMVCGLVFVGIKLAEWAVVIGHGYTLPSNDFFMFYFMLTGVHLLHVVLGLGVLGYVVADLRKPRGPRTWITEVGATYWHMVDLLWVVIFVLLYVMR
jgi:nitric oxide reductase NorE protein